MDCGCLIVSIPECHKACNFNFSITDIWIEYSVWILDIDVYIEANIICFFFRIKQQGLLTVTDFVMYLWNVPFEEILRLDLHHVSAQKNP